MSLPAATRMGPVELTVTDLDRSIPFYRDVLGLRLRQREHGRAALGDDAEDAVVLVEQPGARPAGQHAGLYHVALLYPSRLELARAAQRLAETRTLIDGASDHGTHEAIYLSDPDGNGVELAADRPREAWPTFDEMFSQGPAPLDVEGLFGLVRGQPGPGGAAEGVRVGHVHLHVGDTEAAARFYRDVLGFDVMAAIPQAVFVSAGGYHHHVAFNTWRGVGVGPAPADAVGLRHLTVLVPEVADVEAVRARLQAAGVEHEAGDGTLAARDPAGNRVLVAVDV